jgi:hypothetical protein
MLQVTDLRLNDRYAAVQCDDQVTLHSLEPPNQGQRGAATQKKVFPGTRRQIKRNR